MRKKQVAIWRPTRNISAVMFYIRLITLENINLGPSGCGVFFPPFPRTTDQTAINSQMMMDIHSAEFSISKSDNSEGKNTSGKKKKKVEKNSYIYMAAATR